MRGSICLVLTLGLLSSIPHRAFAQKELGEWTHMVFEQYGFSVMASQEFSETMYTDSLDAQYSVRTISYVETYKDENVVSYISMYELPAYNELPQGRARDEVLEAALTDLAVNSRAEIVYQNVINLPSWDQLSFRLNSIASSKALKGRFVLQGSRMYLIAMYYEPSMRLNKKSNYFIESFRLLL